MDTIKQQKTIVLDQKHHYCLYQPCESNTPYHTTLSQDMPPKSFTHDEFTEDHSTISHVFS